MRKIIKNQVSEPADKKIEFIFSVPEEEPIKSPMENAKEALENFKAQFSKNAGVNLHIKYIEDILKEASKYEAVDFMPKSFIWHRITTITPLADVSCFTHILHCHGAISVFAKSGYYLLGVKGQTICFALPVEKDAPNPISHIDDCTVYIEANGTDYCTVCVSLEPDGQYFTGIC